jgi:hypothetical protein
MRSRAYPKTVALIQKLRSRREIEREIFHPLPEEDFNPRHREIMARDLLLRWRAAAVEGTILLHTSVASYSSSSANATVVAWGTTQASLPPSAAACSDGWMERANICHFFLLWRRLSFERNGTPLSPLAS